MRETALITGGAKRIGKEIALLLSILGYNIALHYNNSKKDAEETARQIYSNNAACEIFKANLESEKDVSGLIKKVKRVFPHVSILVNSASVFEKSSLLETDAQFFNKHFNINLKAPFLLSCEFVRTFKKGNIINILDTNVVKNKTAFSAYLLSKKSLSEFTALSAVEFAPNIRVNAIAPGFILPPKSKGNSYLQKRALNIPLKRRGFPSHIALTVQFLLENDYVTGQTIFVDGGEHLL